MTFESVLIVAGFYHYLCTRGVYINNFFLKKVGTFSTRILTSKRVFYPCYGSKTFYFHLHQSEWPEF